MPLRIAFRRFRREALALLAAGALGAAGAAFAAGSPSAGKSKDEARPSGYEAGVALLDAGRFEQARQKLETAARESPRDPDVLNMLAYSQRKSGQLDRAIATYKRALSLRPRFPQAREYLGEAYLQASLRELETLEGYGPAAKDERARLIHAVRAAATDLPPQPEIAGKPAW